MDLCHPLCAATLDTGEPCLTTATFGAPPRGRLLFCAAHKRKVCLRVRGGVDLIGSGEGSGAGAASRAGATSLPGARATCLLPADSCLGVACAPPVIKGEDGLSLATHRTMLRS